MARIAFLSNIRQLCIYHSLIGVSTLVIQTKNSLSPVVVHMKTLRCNLILFNYSAGLRRSGHSQMGLHFFRIDESVKEFNYLQIYTLS